MPDLEEKIREAQANRSWMKRAFQQEKATIGNHLSSALVSMAAVLAFSCSVKQADYAADDTRNAVIAGISTVIDVGTYWATLLPQLIYRDRDTVKDEDGTLNGYKMVKKAGEYLSYIGIVEGMYVVARSYGQYKLQQQGVDAATASFVLQSSMTAFLIFALPPLWYCLRQWSER